MHLNGKLELEKRALREADECFRLKSDEYATIEKTLNDMKYDISDVKKRYNALQRYRFCHCCLAFILLLLFTVQFVTRRGKGEC